MSNIFELLAPLAETTQSQQELVAEIQSHIALLKDLYKKGNKIK